MTFYDITTGVTACGKSYGKDAFVVAMNADQFGSTPGSSPFCNQMITISFGGKSTSAQVVDKCPGCPYRGLDLTEGLFKFFAPLGAGVIYGTWSGGGGDAPKAPTTSYTPPPSPTTHYEPPSTSHETTHSPPPSSSSSSTSAEKTSSPVSSAAPTTTHQPSSTSNSTQTSTGANYNNAPASSLAQPTGTISPGQNQSINNVYMAMIGFGTLVEAFNP